MKPIEGASTFETAVNPDLLGIGNEWHVAMKRLLYFQADDQRLQNQTWELPESERMLPYRYLNDFLAVMSGKASADIYLSRMVDGISRAEGLPQTASKGNLSLSLSRNSDQELTVIKQFKASEFQCRLITIQKGYVESIPVGMELFHISGSPSIEITLDMFELLSRLADGYTAETQEFEPFLVELREFKSRLLQKEVNEILLLEGRSRLHHVVMEGGTITLKESAR